MRAAMWPIIVGLGLGLGLGLGTGCSSLPDLGTCGNGIVEADNGEACDGTSGCNDTCELECLSQADVQDLGLDSYVQVAGGGADAQFCPTDKFACGQDDICREPSGLFTTTGIAEPFDARSATTGDFDGDGIDDLVGTSATRVVVRLGSQTTPFIDGFEQKSPSSESPIAIFDRDPDHQSMLPSTLALGVPSDGLSLLTSSTEDFEPDLDLTFSTDLTTKAVLTVRDPNDFFELGDTVYTVARMGTLTVERPALPTSQFPVSLPTCGPPNSKLIAITRAPDRTVAEDAFVVVGAPMVDNGTFFVCRYAWPDPAPAPNATFEMTITQVNAAPPTSVVLANMTPTDACLDLVFVRATATNTDYFELPGDPNNVVNKCKLLGTPISLGSLSVSDTLLAAGRIVDVPDGSDQLVATHGVYRPTPLIGGPLLGPTVDINAWTSAAIVDLNNDGHDDVVAGRQGQDDVDVVRGGRSPNVYRADTDFPVTQVVAGDFDGDSLGDVALVESQMGGDRVSILYGTSDGVVGAPVVNSRSEGTLRVAALRRLSWDGSTRGLDGIDDLLVARTAGGETRGGILYGDAPRLMTTQRLPPVGTFTFPGPVGTVAIGKFVDGNTLVAGTLRLENREDPDSDTEVTFNDIVTGEWSDANTVAGFAVDTLRQPVALERGQGSPPLLAAFSKPTGGMSGGVVVAAIDHTGARCSSPTLSGAAFSLHPAELDGDDSADELVVSINNEVRVFPIQPGSPCTFGSELFAGALAGCTDVVDAGNNQAIAMCGAADGRRTGVFRIVDGVRDPKPFAVFDGVGIQLVKGDFNGDGVPDLAVGVARGGEIGAAFLEQCPAHDTRNCH